MYEAKGTGAEIFLSFQLFNEGSLYQNRIICYSVQNWYLQAKKKGREESTTVIYSKARPECRERSEPLLRLLHHNHFPFSFSFLKQGAEKQLHE